MASDGVLYEVTSWPPWAYLRQAGFRYLVAYRDGQPLGMVPFRLEPHFGDALAGPWQVASFEPEVTTSFSLLNELTHWLRENEPGVTGLRLPALRESHPLLPHLLIDGWRGVLRYHMTTRSVNPQPLPAGYRLTSQVETSALADLFWQAHTGLGDVEVVPALGQRDAWGAYIELLLQDEPPTVIALAADGSLAGAAIGGEYQPQVGLVAEVGVAPSQNNRGLGRFLTAHLTAELLKRYPKALLAVTASNTPALKVYQKVGYQVAYEVYYCRYPFQ